MIAILPMCEPTPPSPGPAEYANAAAAEASGKALSMCAESSPGGDTGQRPAYQRTRPHGALLLMAMRDVTTAAAGVILTCAEELAELVERGERMRLEIRAGDVVELRHACAKPDRIVTARRNAPSKLRPRSSCAPSLGFAARHGGPCVFFT